MWMRYRARGPGVMQILLAEHDDEARRAGAAALRRDGYAVQQARDGFELFDLLSDSLLEGVPPAYRLIVSHVSRGWSGLEILRGLRARGCWTPFVLLVPRLGDELRREVNRLGRAIAFDEPFTPQELSNYVRGMVPLRSRARKTLRYGAAPVTTGVGAGALGFWRDWPAASGPLLVSGERPPDHVWGRVEAQLQREGVLQGGGEG